MAANKKDILVVINPNSGKGNSLSIYDKFVYEFICNNFNSTILVSNYKNHINHYINNSDDKFDYILIMGGDGMIHLTLNAIINKGLTIPIGIIPTGSGNGLFKSITHENKMENNLIQSFEIIKSKKIKNIDLIKVSFPEKNKNLISCLGISWGIISDLDINTECMRVIGDLRFDIGAFWYILRKKKYYGVLKYHKNDDEWEEVKGFFIHLWVCNTTHASENTFSSPLSKLDDGYMYISYILAPISRIELTKVMLKLNSGEFIYHPNVKYIKTKKFELNIDDGMIVIDGEREYCKKINCEIMDDGYPFFG